MHARDVIVLMVVWASLSACGQQEAAPGIAATSTTAGKHPRPGEEFDDCSGAGWCPRMVTIPAGTFAMGKPPGEQAYAGYRGSEEPLHTVAVGAFAAAKFEVTFDEWSACVSDRGCDSYSPDDEQWGRRTRPVINVSWDDAQRYVRWLSGKTGRPYRLLTEAEWEYAARAGTTGPYVWGSDPDSGCEHGNGADMTYARQVKGDPHSACDDGAGMRTAPVGGYRPNAFGVYDMTGNVFEWVDDCYHDNYVGAPVDGAAWIDDKCTSRVVRGGSWTSEPLTLRSSARFGGAPSRRGGLWNIGFRVAKTF